MFQPFSMNRQPPQEVLDLVSEYKAHKDTRDLLIVDNMLFLYELSIIKSEHEGNPDVVTRGAFIRRAYWAEASGMSQDMVKSRLGL